MIHNLDKRYTGEDYGNNKSKDRVMPAQIPELAKKADTDIDKFEKEYAYGIRYNYGKEGKKKNWQPWDCMRIIMENIGPGENHGCPFRHHESKTVRQRIESYGLKKDETDVIMKKLE